MPCCGKSLAFSFQTGCHTRANAQSSAPDSARNFFNKSKKRNTQKFSPRARQIRKTRRRKRLAIWYSVRLPWPMDLMRSHNPSSRRRRRRAVSCRCLYYFMAEICSAGRNCLRTQLWCLQQKDIRGHDAVVFLPYFPSADVFLSLLCAARYETLRHLAQQRLFAFWSLFFCCCFYV